MKAIPPTELEIAAAFSNLICVMERWGNQSQASSEREVDEMLASLRQRGWRRRDVYDLLQKTCDHRLDYLPSKSIDYVSDVETAVIGHVAAGSVMRFADDPVESADQLLVFVRSGDWKRA
jgi:hypothetical protein